MRLNRCGYLIREGFRSIGTHGFMSFASVTIIMACLIIMGSVSLLSVNIDALIKDLENENEVVAFVDENIEDEEQAKAIGTAIEELPNVMDAEFVSRDTAMDNFMSNYDDDMMVGIDATVFKHRFVIHLNDISLMAQTQNELKNIQHQTGITFIFVTHDQEEALSMSDTVVVMANGRIQQIGTPTDIYNEPVNAFVADFIGESNILDGTMPADRRARFAGQVFDCVDSGFGKDEPVDVVIRPEDVDVVAPEKGQLKGLVTGVTFKGVHYEIIVDVCGFKWMIQSTDYVSEGQTIGLSIDPDAIHIMKKSEFSGMFGDYSSFSDELDKLSDVTEEAEAE